MQTFFCCEGTGVLSITRDDAILRLQQVGGTYQDEIHRNTDVVVVGNAAPVSAGHGSPARKLRQAIAERKRGRTIATISEMEFLALVKPRKKRP